MCILKLLIAQMKIVTYCIRSTLLMPFLIKKKLDPLLKLMHRVVVMKGIHYQVHADHLLWRVN